MITAIIIDSREPEWVRNLQFGGIPTMAQELDSGDVLASTDDGQVILIERKTSDDLLNTIKEDRLFPQMNRMAQFRLKDQINGKPLSHWPYLVVTGTLRCGAKGEVITQRGSTGWNYVAVQGALLTIQELGVFVYFAANDLDFEAAVLRLGKRHRDQFVDILPPKTPNVFGPGATLIASLPGIGIERTKQIMEWAGNVPAHALSGLVDTSIEAPVPMITRKKIRAMLGLKDQEILAIQYNDKEDEVLKVTE